MAVQLIGSALMVRHTGHMSRELTDVYTRAAEEAYRRVDRVHHFFDFFETTSYASQVRLHLTDFAISQRAHVASATFLVQSRIVAMGVTTAALAVRLVGMQFVVLSQRAEFERLRQAVAPSGVRASLRPGTS